MAKPNALVDALAPHLAGTPPHWLPILDLLLRHFDCVVGTVHLLGADGVMHLEAQRGLPPPVLAKVGTIPIGKGMAGIAAERKAPVQVCNLQTDASGVAKPDAKLTRMEGSIAVPMLDGDRLAGVLGVAKPVAYDFTADEQALLLDVGARLAKRLLPK
ncbi:MAG: GAF domain-containing protein [Planctomycetes bacterium]|nr:GAF domain-containing protein [Planctomycetota bacterium]